MKFIPVKTRALLPPKDDVYKELERSLPKLKEGDVLFIASKVLAIHQRRR
jgi:F420-0:gamma-glutamyl ligase